MEQTQKKPRLEMSLASMRKIEDLIGQWMILEEHCAQNNLDRKYQLDHAKQTYKNIQAEIQEAYRTCPDYSSV